jgi:GDP-L-fucose synthase
MTEDQLLTGPLEPTNEPYAIAKITAIKLCRYYNEQYGTNLISVMPSNLYGIGDNFNLETSHVLPAMIRKFHEAKLARERGEDAEVELWGDGSPKREFLFADDLARGILFLLENHHAADVGEFINIGSGTDLSIKELAETIADVVGYEGPIRWDTSKPNGTPRKLLDVSRMTALGWKPEVSLRDGIEQTYAWFTEHVAEVRR